MKSRIFMKSHIFMKSKFLLLRSRTKKSRIVMKSQYRSLCFSSSASMMMMMMMMMGPTNEVPLTRSVTSQLVSAKDKLDRLKEAKDTGNNYIHHRRFPGKVPGPLAPPDGARVLWNRQWAFCNGIDSGPGIHNWPTVPCPVSSIPCRALRRFACSFALSALDGYWTWRR